MTVEELLDKCINDTLIEITVSNPKRKQENGAVKVKIRPCIIKFALMFQVSEYVGTKVFHKNLSGAELKAAITAYINDFKQIQFNMTDSSATVLSGKNNNTTVKYKKLAKTREKKDINHNRTKNYILKDGTDIPFLKELGVMTNEGMVVKAKYDKFKQINRFLEFIEDIIPELDSTREQTIIDFGCGKSYLTFAMYYYLKVLKGFNVRIIGLDLKDDVINKCNALRTKLGYDKLDFYIGDIASYKDVEHVDMVVTLHACDTATDYALAKAVKWGAKVILSVPCCQHEANKTISNDMLSPVMDYGILKERMAAIVTDAARAKLLEANGYRTQILEFIDMEHTPKNLLIRAVKTNASKEVKEAALSDVKGMEKALNIDITLGKLI